MAVEKWVAGAGVGATWTAAFSTELNSVVNGNAILSSIEINNSAFLDIFMDVSVSLGSITPGAGAPTIGIYLVPLNQDGTSYGDGRFGSSAAGPPPSAYFIGNIPCIASTAGVVTGIIRGIVIPFGRFKLVLHNNSGVTLASSANTVSYRTYDRAVA